MTKVTDKVSVSIGLINAPQSVVNFSTSCVLLDHADVPVDLRYKETVESEFATYFTAATDHVSWLTTLWAQDKVASKAFVGRWLESASSPYMVFNNAITTLASWTPVTDGTMRVTDGTNDDDLTALNFSAATSTADILAVIQVALQAITTPNITGLDTATAFIDKAGRFIIQNSTTGASAATISVGAQGTGTDITGALYLGAEVTQAGLDAESLSAAINAILALNNESFVFCERGADIAEQVAGSTAVQALDKMIIYRISDANAKSAAQTSDTPYQVEALAHAQTVNMYTEHTVALGAAADQNPDAAVCGQILQFPEGSASWGENKLSSVSESGLASNGTTVIPLTATERSALKGKKCDFLINPAGTTTLSEGLTAGSNEARIIQGKMYIAYNISLEIYGYKLAQPVLTYSQEDLDAIEGIVKRWLDVAVARRMIEADYVVTMPLASSFTSVQKATGTMTLSDISNDTIDTAVRDLTISFNWIV